jgi:hypothetical protein
MVVCHRFQNLAASELPKIVAALNQNFPVKILPPDKKWAFDWWPS